MLDGGHWPIWFVWFRIYLHSVGTSRLLRIWIDLLVSVTRGLTLLHTVPTQDMRNRTVSGSGRRLLGESG